jgi:hypothetical protein
MLSMNIVLSDAEDQKKLVALVHNVAPPVEMYELVDSYTSSLSFVLSFGWSGLLTFPRYCLLALGMIRVLNYI